MIEELSSKLRGEGLKARAIRGTAFTIFLFGSQNMLRLASNLVLTRLLFPEAFGLMALMQVVIVGVNLFSDIGMHAVVVRSPRGDDPAFLDTAWSVQVGRGFFLYMMLLLIAPYAAAFYGEPMLSSLIAVGGLQVIFAGMTSIAHLSASRHIRLEKVSVLQVSAQLTALVIMIGLALWWRSVWALAVGAILQSLFFMILSHVVLKGPRRRFRVEKDAFWEIFHFGKYIFLATIAGFFLMHGDRAVLGKFVPLDVLALFTIALVFVQASTDLTNAIANRIVFPLYAQLTPWENDASWRRIARARWMLTLAAAGILGTIAVVGDWLVRLLYDARYHAAGPILVLLAAASIPKIVLQTYPALAMAAGHSGRFAAYLAITALIHMTILIAAVIHAGIVGVALTPALVAVLSYPLLRFMVRPFGGVDSRHDAAMFCFSAGAAALAFWMNQDVLLPLLTAL